MKIISFKIPKIKRDAFHLQIDKLNHFYDKLHQHPEVQLTYIKKGSGTLIAGNHIGRFEPGDVFIIGSSMPHVFRNDTINSERQHKEQSIGFSLYIDIKAWKDGFWSGEETMPVGQFFQQCYSAYKAEGKTRYLLSAGLQRMESLQGFECMLCMLEMLYHVYKNKQSLEIISGEGDWHTIKGNDGMRMGDVIQFTLNESHRPINLSEAAAIANMTEEAFCRYFKSHTRKTYITFLNEVRINNACKMLLNGSQSKSEVAYQSGFNNLSYFNRTFKKIIGKTPREYLAKFGRQ
jgi:AraC-like DNA-binding protein